MALRAMVHAAWIPSVISKCLPLINLFRKGQKSPAAQIWAVGLLKKRWDPSLGHVALHNVNPFFSCSSSKSIHFFPNGV